MPNTGHIVDKLPLDVREWDCPECGTHHDRDINAANNILAAFSSGKTLVYEAYYENRFTERQQKLNQIQSIKANGLDFLRQKYGVNPQQRASKTNERFCRNSVRTGYSV